ATRRAGERGATEPVVDRNVVWRSAAGARGAGNRGGAAGELPRGTCGGAGSDRTGGGEHARCLQAARRSGGVQRRLGGGPGAWKLVLRDERAAVADGQGADGPDQRVPMRSGADR